MDNALLRARSLGQSIWYDNIRRSLIASGELGELVKKGITGVTSNPTIFEKAFSGSTDYDSPLVELIEAGLSPIEIFESLSIDDIQGAADVLRKIYDTTDGADGFASYELPPHLAHDTAGSVREAHRLFKALGRPNVMIKVPATTEGIVAVRQLIGDGINVNVTLIFSLQAYEAVMEAYIGGLEELVTRGGQPARVASVASFFVSRVDTAVDAQLGPESSLTGKAAVANACVAYAHFREAFGTKRFRTLVDKGARVQRPLWASTSTKNPLLSDTLYFDELVGPDTVNTMPDATVAAVLDHGNPAIRLDANATDARSSLTTLAQLGVDLEAITAKLLTDGVEAFAESYDAAIASIRKKCDSVSNAPSASFGAASTTVNANLKRVKVDQVIPRIWAHDHTLWSLEPTEITDRLGWLGVADKMLPQLAELKQFAEEIQASGFQHTVLLAMGGSAFAPELYRNVFGRAAKYPDFIMLDSTLPGWVQRVTDTIDPARTLFIVSSKSGGTVEVLSFYRYFRALVDAQLGFKQAGANFIAITDPGTSLDTLGQTEEFRKVFLNSPDIGGRFSGLSLFGLIPASLMGVDVARHIRVADKMRQWCQADVPADNPGAWLGAAIAGLAECGYDKLEFITSPSIKTMGLWVEQLLAESLGKDGRGIIPVAGEPFLGVSAYNSDRVFVYIRLEGDDNLVTDGHVQSLAAAGKPTIRLGLNDPYDIGAEMYRWEFAVAVIGALEHVHVFNQPNVQEAKDIARSAIEIHARDGQLPPPDKTLTLDQVLETITSGDYVAFQAFLVQTPELDAALNRARRAVVDRFGNAVTAGYGPRYLHSTGQLHKAGPNSGVFIQLVGDSGDNALPVSGTTYSFQILAEAQADGDLHALLQRGRRIVRLNVGGDPVKAVDEITGRIIAGT